MYYYYQIINVITMCSYTQRIEWNKLSHVHWGLSNGIGENVGTQWGKLEVKFTAQKGKLQHFITK